MYGELYDLTIENWKEIMDVNLWGVINGTQVGYKLMKKQGFGHIVNTSSAAGLGPSPGSSAYATTKGRKHQPQEAKHIATNEL